MKDKKQMQQATLLGVLVVLCLGTICFMTFKGKSAPAPVKAKPADVKMAQAPVADEAAASTDSAVAPVEDAAPVATEQAVVAQRDPFAPMMDTTARMVVNVPRPSRPIQMASAGHVPNLGSFLSGFGGGGSSQPLPPVQPAVNPQQQTPPPAEPPAPAFVLTGIITGDTNVAIIRLNDNRYIVREGQTIDGSYKVVSVAESSVRLARSGHEDIVLELGG